VRFRIKIREVEVEHVFETFGRDGVGDAHYPSLAGREPLKRFAAIETKGRDPPSFLNVKGKSHVTRFDSDHGEIEVALSRERNAAVYVGPSRAAWGQAIIRDRDFHFAFGRRVFIQESETVEERDLRKRNDEGRLAFLERATERVVVHDQSRRAGTFLFRISHFRHPAIGSDEIDRCAAVHPRQIFRGVAVIGFRRVLTGTKGMSQSAGKNERYYHAHEAAARFDGEKTKHIDLNSKLRAGHPPRLFTTASPREAHHSI